MFRHMPTFRNILAILFAAALVAAVANLVHPRKIPWVQDWSSHIEAKAKKLGIKVVPLSTALRKHGAPGTVFIDARPAAEFAAGHVAGALSVPMQSLGEHFETVGELIDSGQELVVYCRSRDCDDALALLIELRAIGAERLVFYVDGFAAWKKYGGEVEP
jgi:rhodanese-related sulfurtransferase